MQNKIERAALCLVGLMTVAPAAFAGDRVFVTEGAKVEAFDFDTGQGLPGSPIALSGTAGDVSRSRSGLYYYVADDQGQVRVVDTRSTNVFLSPAQVPGSEQDMSLDALRGDILFATGAWSIHKQDAAGFGYAGQTHFGTDMISVAGLNNGEAVYGFDSRGNRLEWDAATGAVTYIGYAFGQWTQEMESSVDSRLVISAGNDEFSLVTGKHDIYQPSLQVYDRATRQEIYREGWPAYPWRTRTRIAVSGSDPSKFWVLVEGEGIFAYQVSGTVVHKLANVPTWGLDLASNRAGDLYVLQRERIERYAGGTQLDGTMSLPKKSWDRLVVTPELPPSKGIMIALRPEWVGLLKALKMKGMGQPWKLDPFQSSDEGCDPKAVYGAMKRAFAWLEKLKDKDGILDPTQVAQFLAEAESSDPISAEYFLDLLLLEIEGK